MITAAEVRGGAIAYYKIKTLILKQPLTPEYRARLLEFQGDIERDCLAVTETSSPARWAGSQVGPVLGAAVGAAAYMRDIASPNTALRIYGLTGDHALTAQAAWALVQPYLPEPLPAESVQEIIHRSGIRLKLQQRPTAAEVLCELTRPRGGAFPIQVSHWLSSYFQEHRLDRTEYAEHYRKALTDVFAINERGDLAQFTNAHGVYGRLCQSDWEALVDGRIPQSRLEIRAGYTVARQFIVEYWERWNAKKEATLQNTA